MKKVAILTLLVLGLTKSVTGQVVRVVSFEELENQINQNTDTTYIFNFWATWCKPCQSEMAAFRKIADENINQKLKVILVSLDFVDEIQKVKNFLKVNPIKAEVVLLNAPDQDKWINSVSSAWSGGLPSTLFINNKQKVRRFLEKEMNFSEIINEIKAIK